jgi:allantoinase
VLVLSLQPFLIGRPFRIASLDTALGHIAGHEGVWTATGSEVIDWY